MKLLLTNLFSECDVDLFAFTKEVLNNELHFSILFYFVFLQCVCPSI